MVCALQTLDALRRKVKWQYQLQWDSMRGTPTWYNNAWEAVEGSYQVGYIYSLNENKVYEYTVPTEIRQFSRFMMMEKLSMVVVREKDEILTVDRLLFIGDIAKKDWVKSNSEE